MIFPQRCRDRMHTDLSILLVCERSEQVTGGGCCGSLEDGNELLGTNNLFAESRSHQEKVGILYRMVRRFFSDELESGRIIMHTVDPRNQLYLAPKLWRDVICCRPGMRAGLRTAFQFFSIPAVIVNGRVHGTRNRMIDPDALCHLIQEHLEQEDFNKTASRRR